jgi:hypothetical protein
LTALGTRRTQYVMVQTFQDVIDKLGGVASFADAVGMKQNTAKVARRRNSIGAHWFPVVARVARERGVPEIDEAALSQLARERRSA